MKTNSDIQHNLPVQLNSFIGRQKDIEHLMKLLDDTRLLTLTGTGGVGKTRLSLQVAGSMLETFINGVWFIELAQVINTEHLIHRISSTLEIHDSGNHNCLDMLTSFLKNRNLLLILDNCEHLIQEDARLASYLEHMLCSCPDLKILASSREPICIAGETIYRVLPLPLPVLEENFQVDNLIQYEAVQLFVERARAFSPGFDLSDETASNIVDICHLMDGIPLAIELAAARTNMLSLPQISHDLEDSLRLLTRGGKTSTPRQQTLLASMAWSFGLLTDKEKILFQRLAVFSGKFLLPDVEVLCCDTAETDDSSRPAISLDSVEILDLLSNLVDKSLVNVTPDGYTSYRLLNPIHLFALEKLKASSEESSQRDLHLHYYCEFSQNTHLIIQCHDLPLLLKRFEIEIDNLRSALDWSVKSHSIESGLSLACNLGEFWWRQG